MWKPVHQVCAGLCTQRHPHVLLNLVSCAGRGGRERIYSGITLGVCHRPPVGVSVFLAVLDTKFPLSVVVVNSTLLEFRDHLTKRYRLKSSDSLMELDAKSFCENHCTQPLRISSLATYILHDTLLLELYLCINSSEENQCAQHVNK